MNGATSRTALARLRRELKDMLESPPDGCRAAPVSDANMLRWRAVVDGPPGTPYEGGRFRLELDFPNDYPFRPPRVTFVTKIYHCNISQRGGSVCMDLLKSSHWTPALTVGKLLLTVVALLCEPNAADPLSPHVAHLYKNERQEHDRIARTWTSLYAQAELCAGDTAAIERWRVQRADDRRQQAAKVLCDLLDAVADADKQPAAKSDGERP